jgi:hypothetical protein
MLIGTATQALTYVASHPTLLVRSALNALHREVTIPIALLQWAIDKRPRGKGPERIELSAADGQLGLGLTVDLYGTKLDVNAKLVVESLALEGEALALTLRVHDLQLKAPPNTPAAFMVQSLDLTRPAALMKMMPQKHAMLVSAEDDRFVLDLLKIKALANNPVVRRVLSLGSVVRVSGSRTDDDNFVLSFATRFFG